MADVFNRNPSEYFDMNALFPVLNGQVGFNYEQLQKMVENTNFLKNNLATSVMGTIEKVPVTDPNDADLEVTTREVFDGDKKTVYLDFIYYVYVPETSGGGGAVNSVNGQTGDVSLNADDVGAVSYRSSSGTISSTISNSNGSTTISTVKQIETTTPQILNQMWIHENGLEVNIFNGGFRYNGNNVATLVDIESAIGNVSALLGDTEDLEV